MDAMFGVGFNIQGGGVYWYRNLVVRCDGFSFLGCFSLKIFQFVSIVRCLFFAIIRPVVLEWIVADVEFEPYKSDGARNWND
jgi:hypothetical protein